MVGALPLEDQGAMASEHLTQLEEEARLAHPRLAHEPDDVAPSRGCDLPRALVQKRQLFCPADERAPPRAG